jgi:hypothetical protein
LPCDVSAIRDFITTELNDQCVCIVFLQSGKMLRKYTKGSKQLSVTMPCEEQTFYCFARVRREETSVEGCEHAGCPAASRRVENAEKVCKIVIENRRSINL